MLFYAAGTTGNVLINERGVPVFQRSLIIMEIPIIFVSRTYAKRIAKGR